ncbi:MAG: bifunctional DNA primase/polymerase [Candidatus Marinimicrobia bacterium]|nr:bifunctional DNA primase/polymerase [Candidatus Neomarinimicrobiota bacterium]
MYSGFGYSVIPIYGDTQPERAKVAAVSWKTYQIHRPSDEQLSEWFEDEKHGGLAIVTGRVSNLIVLDFDSGKLQYEFEKQFSDLLNTRIVTSASRGLSHYYYKIPVYINLATQHIDGADLLSNGCYVIAPPTVVQGKEYKIQRGGMPYQLTQSDAHRLKKFFNARQEAKSNSFPSILLSSEPKLSASINTEDNSIQPNKTQINSISPESLIHLYQHYAPQIGRNNSLFKVACHARDRHLNMIQVKETLKTVHAQQITHEPHTSETHAQRLQEADNTIKSAFSQPPKDIQSASSQLPNSIREAFLKKGLTCVARVLDGLFLNGFKSGDIVTKKIVTDTLQGQVGRHSILATFSARLDATIPVFETIFPPPRTPTHTSVAKDKNKKQQTKCFMFSQTKSDKISRGRIPTQFRIPDINVLCDILHVPFTRSDSLQPDDIQKAKIYRKAVHRELIKRRPGMYHRRWLAKRLGVSRRTSQRYDNDIVGIQRKPMYIYQSITWKNLHVIPLDESIGGRFLEDGNRKRYPGLRQIAARLLAQKKSVQYGYQDMNYYWYGDNLPLISVRWGINPKQKEADENYKKVEKYLIQRYWKNLRAKKHVQSVSKPHIPSPIKKQIEANEPISRMANESQEPTPYKPKSKRVYQKALSDSRAEYLATRLYQAVWDRATGEQSRLSQPNARRLVDEYGETLIRRALGVLKYRQNINNPAGFMVIWLRSTAKSIGV